jgi:hypothetical protein
MCTILTTEPKVTNFGRQKKASLPSYLIQLETLHKDDILPVFLLSRNVFIFDLDESEAKYVEYHWACCCSAAI